VVVVPAIDIHSVHPTTAAAALVGGALPVVVVVVVVVVMLRMAAVVLLLQVPFFLALLPFFLPLLLAKARRSLHHVLAKRIHPTQHTHVLIPSPPPPPRIVAVVLIPAPTIRAHAAQALVVIVPSISTRGQVLLAAAVVLAVKVPRPGRRRRRCVECQHVVLGVAFVQGTGPCRDVRRRGRALQWWQVLVVVTVWWVALVGQAPGRVKGRWRWWGQVQSGRVGLHPIAYVGLTYTCTCVCLSWLPPALFLL